MLRKILNKIESKRNSKKFFWRTAVLSKDFVWYCIYVFPRKIRDNPAAIFGNIYKRKLWGNKKDFFSGEGSLPENTLQYRNYIERFVKEKDIHKILDLGCGNFRIGKLINWHNASYVGVDVVKPLIKRNNLLFSGKKIRFIKKNIIKDKLPDADLCLIREVLQHLPNKDIKKILKKITKYKYVLITDCQPKNPEKKLNLDILLGGYRKSGLYLESPPFNQKVEIVLSYPKKNKTGIMRTLLIENNMKK